VRKGDTLISIALEYGLDPRELASWNRIDNPNLIRVGQELRLRAPAGEATGGASPVPAAPPTPVAATPLPGAVRAPGTEGVRTEPKALRQPFSEKALAEATAAPRRAPAATGAGGSSAPVAAAPAAPAAAAEPVPAGRAGEAAEGVSAARVWAWPSTGQVIERFSDVNRGIDIAGRAGQPILASADGRVVYSGAGIRGYGRMLIVKHDDVYVSVYAHASELLVKEGQTVSRGQRIAEMGSTDTDRVKLHFEIRRMGRPVDPLSYLPAAPGS
jgi:lipoprotein NlpD